MSRTMDNDAYNGLYAQHIKSCATIIALRSQIDKQEIQLQAYETQITLQEDGPSSLLERLERQKRDLDYYASEVERLKATYEKVRIAYTYEKSEADTLRARVEELDDTLEMLNVLHHKVCLERDELRTRLTAEQDAGHKAAARIVELEASNKELHRRVTNQEAWARTKDAEKERDSLRHLLDNAAQSEAKWMEEALQLREQLAAIQPAKPSVVKSTWQAVSQDDEHSNPEMASNACAVEYGEEVIAVLRRDHMSDGTVVVTLETIGDEK